MRILAIFLILSIIFRGKNNTKKTKADKTKDNPNKRAPKRPGKTSNREAGLDNLNDMFSDIIGNKLGFTKKEEVKEVEISEKIKKQDEANREKRKISENKMELERKLREEKDNIKKEKVKITTKLNEERLKKEVVNGIIFSEILREPVSKRRRRP